MAPLPKDPAVRQRRNKTTTHAKLHALAPDEISIPPIQPTDRDWQQLTLDWWNDIWCSPMSKEFDRADMHRLFMLAVLVDQFWIAPSSNAHIEVRLAAQAFGLTPLDRRRLQWEIVKTDEAIAKANPKPPKTKADPRLKAG